MNDQPSGRFEFRSKTVLHENWADWGWHLRNAIRSVRALEEWIDVAPEERRGISLTEARYRWQITPYYASLMDLSNPCCPIRLQAIPSAAEMETIAGSSMDPVDELAHRKTNRVTHKYPDRVILNLTRVCPVYCRHCTRKYHTTDREGSYFAGHESDSLEPDLAYIASDSRIRDVLVTGGDPLSYPDERLDRLLSALREIPHVEIIRIGTRFPVLLPQRITPSLCEVLARYHPIWLTTHFNHPREVTPEAASACDLLSRHGIPVQNQTVLLKGVNDDPDTMMALVHALLKIRVRPYYLYHCDRQTGVSHFETSIETGHAIMNRLWGWTTGFAIPRYIITSPVGKVSLEEPQIRDLGDELVLRGWAGNDYVYHKILD
jgi:lysine 2,3-aminomutase